MTIADVWDNPRPWPHLIYIATTNYCNAKCICCVNHQYKRLRGTMSFDNFKIIADKIKAKGVMIGAMFCFGEPLMDPTLFDKCAYARSLGVLMPRIGLNTNVSLLTSEKFKAIIDNTPNITLSFFNTGDEYERLTKLNWEVSYHNALMFIEFRDRYKPDYPIIIGVNKIAGHSLENVQKAFAGKRVEYTWDVELELGGKVLTGPLNRLIPWPAWRCDGYSGCIQVIWNGDCQMCAFDYCGVERGETSFGNILTDSWETLFTNFRKQWKEGPSLCKRCDFWHHAKQVVESGFPNPLPSDWNDWQKPYLETE